MSLLSFSSKKLCAKFRVSIAKNIMFVEYINHDYTLFVFIFTISHTFNSCSLLYFTNRRRKVSPVRVGRGKVCRVEVRIQKDIAKTMIFELGLEWWKWGENRNRMHKGAKTEKLSSSVWLRNSKTLVYKF